MPDLRVLITRFTPALLLGSIIVCAVPIAPAAQPSKKISQIKAAFVVNFINLTTWPDSAFTDNKSPLVITLVGADPADTVLEDSIGTQKLRGRLVEFHRVDLPRHETYRTDSDYNEAWSGAMQSLRKSHVVLFASSTDPQMIQAANDLNSRTTLTIGDGESYLQTPTMLNLAEEDGHIIFFATPQSIQQSNLTISSRLLRLAKINKS